MTTMLRFRCNACNKKLKADERIAGATLKCPRCGEEVAVPAPEVSMAAAGTSGGDGDESFQFSNLREPNELMDMTPMVDAVFLHLLFFMVTASFSLQKSIQVPAPDPTEAAAQDRTIEEIEEDTDYIVVRIDRDNNKPFSARRCPSSQPDFCAKETTEEFCGCLVGHPLFRGCRHPDSQGISVIADDLSASCSRHNPHCQG